MGLEARMARSCRTGGLGFHSFLGELVYKSWAKVLISQIIPSLRERCHSVSLGVGRSVLLDSMIVTLLIPSRNRNFPSPIKARKAPAHHP